MGFKDWLMSENTTLFPPDTINQTVTDQRKIRRDREVVLITYQYEGNPHVFKSWVPADVVQQYLKGGVKPKNRPSSN